MSSAAPPDSVHTSGQQVWEAARLAEMSRQAGLEGQQAGWRTCSRVCQKGTDALERGTTPILRTQGTAPAFWLCQAVGGLRLIGSPSGGQWKKGRLGAFGGPAGWQGYPPVAGQRPCPQGWSPLCDSSAVPGFTVSQRWIRRSHCSFGNRTSYVGHLYSSRLPEAGSPCQNRNLLSRWLRAGLGGTTTP